ncbi:MAG: hypothetical protein ACOH2D_14425 [Gelidibacter sp.]
MKIRYPKKRLKVNLILGIVWLVFGILAFTFDGTNLFNLGYLAFGLIYLGLYLFENSKQYLTIENGVITKNTLHPKSIKLNEINHINDFAGDYVLKTEHEELSINKSYIEKNSLLALETILEGLNLDVKETINVQSNLS